MLRTFDLLMKLYPADYRAEFAGEMRAVFLQLLSRGRGSTAKECWGLVCGAGREWIRLGRVLARTLAAIAAGILCAGWAQLLLYRYLVSHLAIACLFAVGIASAQPPRQDPAALETARSLYRAAFTALRDARTMDDMRRLAATFTGPEFSSVDRFGRTVPRSALDAELEELLALPPERRVTGMDIFWAEQDSGRLIVLAWMMPSVAERKDAEGVYGQPGATHRLTRGTLVRDIFAKTEDGWRRIRHDKLTPNDTVLAVDGTARIVPPLDEPNRITLSK